MNLERPDSPGPVTNYIEYSYHVIAKCVNFLFFGLGSVVIGLICFPVMRLIFHPQTRFRKYARRLIAATWWFFTVSMRFFHLVKLDVDDRAAFRKLGGKIVVANHPSLLDVVMLISLIPNADCIVAGYLTRTVMRAVIKQLYIINAVTFEGLAESCRASLAEGNCLVIFPEGTRTRRNQPMRLKRGAARIALQTGCDIVPVYIGGPDQHGLGKHEPFLSYTPSGMYVYRLDMQDVIPVSDFSALPPAVAARRMTEKILDVFLHPDVK